MSQNKNSINFLNKLEFGMIVHFMTDYFGYLISMGKMLQSQIQFKLHFHY